MSDFSILTFKNKLFSLTSCSRETIYVYKIIVENLKERDQPEDLGVDERITLR
jgi:hypothetical protein